MNLTTYMLKKIKIALFVATFLIFADSKSQQFDVTLTHQSMYSADDPAIFREFITCRSVNSGRTVSIGTVDGAPGPLRWFFNEIDSSGVKVSTNCKEIKSSPNTRFIVLMDIKPLKSNLGYVACGYQFSNMSPNIFKPLSILFDISGVPNQIGCCYELSK